MHAMAQVLRKQLAFIKRGYLIESSYSVAFLLEFSTTLFPVLMFFFVGKLVEGHVSESLRPYGGSYFPFALVGVGLTQFLSKALKIFSTSIRRAQMSGVLEASLSTPTQPAALVLYDATFSFLMASTQLVFVFFLGGWLLGARFDGANLLSVAVLGGCSVATFAALGILAAAAAIVLKKGDPIDVILGSGALVLSGAYFPISVMPESIQSIAQLIPTTHALEGLRRALFVGASLQDLSKEVLILAGSGLVLFPASLFAFHAAVEKGRRDGTLLHY
jgi:ABC-2 type transport system permease protein